MSVVGRTQGNWGTGRITPAVGWFVFVANLVLIAGSPAHYVNIVVNLVRDFAAFKGKEYASSSRRVYVAAAKKALKFLGDTARQCTSGDDLLALLAERRAMGEIPPTLRLTPFLEFVQSGTAGAIKVDLGPIRAWIIASVHKDTKTPTQTSYLIRRDLAMVSGLCLAPEKKSPRHWPRSALAVTKLGSGRFRISLWDQEVAQEGLGLPLLYWHFWRERLARPEQSRLQRKEKWAFSDLLFPNSQGRELQRQVLHDALSRMQARHRGPLI